jgi:hypothetical protein
MVYMMNKKLFNIRNILVLLISFFVLFRIFEGLGSLFISGGDLFFPVYPLNLSFAWFSSYIDQLYLGIPSATYINAIFPYLIYFDIIYLLGLDASFSQKVWFFLIILLPFFTFFYLLCKINNDRLMKHISFKLISSVYYAFNPYTAVMFLSSNILIVYGFIPLFIALIIEQFNCPNGKKIYLLPMLSIFLIYSGTNPPAYFILIIVTVIFWIGLYFSKMRTARSFGLLNHAILAAIAYFFVNLFWVIPLLFVPTNMLSLQSGNDWFWASKSSSLLNIFRGFGNWAFADQAFHSDYFPFHSFYNNYLLIFSGFLLAILIAYSLLLRRKNGLIFYLFSIIYIISIFMAKGIQCPFEGIFYFLYDNVPGFWMFREPWSKWMPLVLLSSSVLLYFSMRDVYTYIIAKDKINTRRIMLCIFFLLVIINAYPFFSGKVVIGERGDFPGARIQIPDYWYDCANYINEKMITGRVLLLPQNPFYQVHFCWWGDGYYGIDPAPYFIFKSFISVDPGGGYIKSSNSNKMVELFFESPLKFSSFKAQNFLSLLNARYVLHRKDLDWTQLGRSDYGSPQKTMHFIDHNHLGILEKRFGGFNLSKISDQYFLNHLLLKNSYLKNESAIDLYVINDSSFLPKIYTTKNIIIYNGSIDLLPIIVSAKNYDIRSATLAATAIDSTLTKTIYTNFKILHPGFKYSATKSFFDAALPADDLLLDNASNYTNYSEPPKIEFKKISSTKYRIRIHNATSPFLLVFSESFYDEWKLYAMNYTRQSIKVSSFKENLSTNDTDIANLAEVDNFIENGLITSLNYNDILKKNPICINVLNLYNSNYNNFISRNYKGSIENNNLPDGAIYETWFKESLDNHLLANGYANSWVIDPGSVWMNKHIGTKNQDGSYDFEVILEYWPQQIFYIALMFSILTLSLLVFFFISKCIIKL